MRTSIGSVIVGMVALGCNLAIAAGETPVIAKLRTAHKDLKVVAEVSVGSEAIIKTLAKKAGVTGIAADTAVKVFDKVAKKYLKKKGKKTSKIKFSDFSVAIIYSKDLKSTHSPNNPGFALIVSEVSPVAKATEFVKNGAVGFSSKGGIGVTSSLGGFEIGDMGGGTFSALASFWFDSLARCPLLQYRNTWPGRALSADRLPDRRCAVGIPARREPWACPSIRGLRRPAQLYYIAPN